ISYGRNPDERSAVGFLVEPTPGAANSSQGDGFASSVVFSRESGTFVDPFVIEMSAAPGSVIHYTTTTNLPTLASPVYAGPLRRPGPPGDRRGSLRARPAAGTAPHWALLSTEPQRGPHPLGPAHRHSRQFRCRPCARQRRTICLPDGLRAKNERAQLHHQRA